MSATPCTSYTCHHAHLSSTTAHKYATLAFTHRGSRDTTIQGQEGQLDGNRQPLRAPLLAPGMRCSAFRM
ncbi:hypothetical protein E2C01_072387 [Portunus trituberculatus]|uniref:Uncharacterized protein n=1 Tax=Portunus trituberculatus TaxID=210409 RepID=A0A5B7IAL0_PORTR|nr:hypothetical protein [Portunus trituberculatus]